MKRWTVEILLGEDDGRTYAEAYLRDEIGNRLVGVGQARLHPGEPDVPEIGDEIAVARALTDLGHRLLITAAGDLSTLARDAVRLTG